MQKRERKGEENNARIKEEKQAKEAKTTQKMIKRAEVCLYQEKIT